MARVHTIDGASLGSSGSQCKTFKNPRNGCVYTTCKVGRRWKIQPNPKCPKR